MSGQRDGDTVDFEVDAEHPREITVVLGDDQEGTRFGVRRALEAAGVQVVAEAATMRQVLAAAIKHQPAVCLLAVHLPGNGIVAAEQIKAEVPAAKVVMLTGSDRDEDLFAALQAGADGYLLKTISADRLARTIRGVVAGEAAMSRVLVARLIEEYRNRGGRRVLRLSEAGPSVELTPREFDVIMRLRTGEGTAEIANELRISEVTVRRHIADIVHKLHVPNRRTALALIRQAELSVAPAHR